MRTALLTLVVLLVQPILATAADQPAAWSANPEFDIEGASTGETILFIAGMSYGMSYLNKAYENAGVKVGICLADGKKFIGAKEIVDILNAAGEKTYTSDKATSTVVQELAKRNPCK